VGRAFNVGGALFNSAAPSPPPPAAPNTRTAMIGDSLTTHRLDYNWSPFFWINGIAARGAQKLVANAGVAGETVSQMLARVNNLYTDASPGLAGLSPLGLVYVRAGTNDARNGTSIATLATNYTAFLNAVKTYCDRVIILSVPPIGSTESSFATKNALTLDYNSWLSAFAAANPSGFTYVNDSANLRDGGGAQLSGYFNSDGIHNDGRATWRQGVDASAALSSLFSSYSYASPVSSDAADVYPAQPQWVPNHVMAGAGPTATGWGIGALGAGFTLSTSLVAADGGDPNPTPWQRVTPTSVGYTGSGEAIVITSSLTGRSVTTTDPLAWDIIVEVRFNGFDTRPFKWARLWVMSVSSGQPITEDLDLKMGGESSITHESVVVRFAMPRKTLNNEAGGVSLRWEWATRSAYSGAMGSFDFRCLTVRG
jgi:lysophospholipase L1-like esterase